MRATERAEVAQLKGDPRMAEVIARACRTSVRRPDEALSAETRWGSVSVGVDDGAALVDAALSSGGSVNAERLRFRRALTRLVTAGLSERRPDLVVDGDEVAADLRADRQLQRRLNRIWPAQSSAVVIRSLLGRRRMLAEVAGDLLSVEEQRRLHRASGPSVGAERWTEADLPLLDEAEHQLSGPPRRYGYIVVDEAQDLSAMALRMVARRSVDGRSMTILGDLAQATAPGAPGDWAASIAALGSPAGACVTELLTGYRVPRQIMDLANRLLATGGPSLPTTVSVRVGDEDPQWRRVAAHELVTATVEVSATLLDRYSSVGVVAESRRLPALLDALRDQGVPTTRLGQPPATGEISLLQAGQAKGLEFDAVVVVEPTELLVEHGGVGLVYIALTRAVQHLSIVHTVAFPPEPFPVTNPRYT